MARAAFERDGILTLEERVESAGKCLELLSGHRDEMSEKEIFFVDSMAAEVHHRFPRVSEYQLAWLRDITMKFCQ